MESRFHDRYRKIGLNIYFYRKKRRLTQTQLAMMIMRSRNHVQQIETANAVPSLETLMKIAEVLGVPVERIMTDDR